MKEQFLLEPGITFLNHGSFGACPGEVLERCHGYQWELERQPVRFMQREFPERMQRARAALAGFLATGADQLAFANNATIALNTIAASLGDVLGPGDEVLSTDLEYGAMDRMWEAVCARRGARYRRLGISLPATGQEIADAMTEAFRAATRVLFVSHITSTTALQLPVRELVAAAKARGVVSVVDGAHAPGMVPLRLDDLDADFYVGNCHKWMMAPKGAGFLWVNPRAEHLLRPLAVSWGRHSLSAKTFLKELEYQGTQNIAPYLAVADAIRFAQQHDWPAVIEQCRAIADRIETGLCSLIGGESPYAGDPALRPPQMRALPLPMETDAVALHATLWERFQVEVPVTTHPPSGRPYLRISIQGYNNAEDGARLLEALRLLLPCNRPG